VVDKNKKREKIIRKKGKLEDRKVSILTETDRCKEKHLYRVVSQIIPKMPQDDKRQGKELSKVSLAFPWSWRVASLLSRNAASTSLHIFPSSVSPRFQ
jgi:hypothetical protein